MSLVVLDVDLLTSDGSSGIEALACSGTGGAFFLGTKVFATFESVCADSKGCISFSLEAEETGETFFLGTSGSENVSGFELAECERRLGERGGTGGPFFFGIAVISGSVFVSVKRGCGEPLDATMVLSGNVAAFRGAGASTLGKLTGVFDLLVFFGVNIVSLNPGGTDLLGCGTGGRVELADWAS